MEPFNIPTPTVATPGPTHGINPLLVDDIIPPRYPDGANLVFQRPGELGVVVTCPVPAGAMVCIIAPEEAVHVRAGIRDFLDKQAAAVKALHNGHLGRRG